MCGDAGIMMAGSVTTKYFLKESTGPDHIEILETCVFNPQLETVPNFPFYHVAKETQAP